MGWPIIGIVVGALLSWLGSQQIGLPASYCVAPSGCNPEPISVPLLVVSLPILGFSTLMLGLTFRSKGAAEPSTLMDAGASGWSAFHGMTLYLFAAGVLSLLLSPFLPWFQAGVGPYLERQVSLISSYDSYGVGLVFYMAGLVASVTTALAFRKPVSYQGMVTALFPLFYFAIGIARWEISGFRGYPVMFAPGILLALLGSALLEASYLAYNRDISVNGIGFAANIATPLKAR